MKKIISTMIAIAALAMPFSEIEASAAGAKSEIQISTVSAETGKEIDVPVEITSNEGIVAMSFTIEYDTNSLELLNVTDCGLFAEASYTQGGDIKAVPFRMMWENGLAKDNYNETGEIAILHFSVIDSEKSGFSEIKINIEADNTFDVDLENVAFEGINGGVEIKGAEPITTTSTTTMETTTTTSTTETTTTIATSTINTTTAKEKTTLSTTKTTATTAASSATTAPETTAVSTAKYFASIAEMCDMAKKDYKTKNNVYPDSASAEELPNGSVSIKLFEADGELLDTYMIDPVTGIGISENGSGVNLPQTGNNSCKTAATASAALVLALLGLYAVVKSGVLRKAEDEK